MQGPLQQQQQQFVSVNFGLVICASLIAFYSEILDSSTEQLQHMQ